RSRQDVSPLARRRGELVALLRGLPVAGGRSRGGTLLAHRRGAARRPGVPSALPRAPPRHHRAPASTGVPGQDRDVARLMISPVDTGGRRRPGIPMPGDFDDNLGVLASMLAGDAEGAARCLEYRCPAPERFLRFVERHRLAGYLLDFLDHPGNCPEAGSRIRRAIGEKALGPTIRARAE